MLVIHKSYTSLFPISIVIILNLSSFAHRTFEYSLEGSSELLIAESINNRVNCTVKIGQPETKRVEFRWDQVRVDCTKVKYDVKRHPTYEITN